MLARWVMPAVVALAFVLSRILYRALGVGFDATPLSWFWQYIDPELLRSAFGQSIWHLHSQPPLMNLYLGVVLRLFPAHFVGAFQTTFLLLGLAAALGIYFLLVEAGVSPTLAAVLAVLFSACPATVLYENWLFYTYPVACFLVWAGLFWVRFMKQASARDVVGFSACAVATALTWSLFHLVWVVLALGLMVWLRPGQRRRVVLACAVPVAVLLFWYGKNLVMFGQFTGSTWFGLSFSKITNGMLWFEERNELHSRGVISDLSLLPPFSDLDKYGRYVPLPATGIPALDQRLKPSGVPNYNNLAYVTVSRRLGQDAFRILRARPAAYLRGVAESYLTFFLPASVNLFVAKNGRRIRGLTRASEYLSGRFVFAVNRQLRRTDPGAYYVQALSNLGFVLVAIYLLAFAMGLRRLLRGRDRATAADTALLFIWLTVVYGSLAGNLLEVGENNRFRFVLDPLVLVPVAVAIQQWFARRRPTRPRP